MRSMQGWVRNSPFLAWVVLCCLLTGVGGAWARVSGTFCPAGPGGCFAQKVPDTLPEGKGVEKVKQHCGTCHGIEIVAQQRLDRTGWTSVVDQMIEFGAALSPEERREIMDYLVSYLGPDKRGG